jgi:hypothetical protein
MIHIDQMILSEPSIIIIWTYQDMMEWMSRILVGEMAGADEDFDSEVRKWANAADFGSHPYTFSNPADPHGPDDPFRTINYHHLDIAAGCWLEKWLVLMRILALKWGKCGWFSFNFLMRFDLSLFISYCS